MTQALVAAVVAVLAISVGVVLRRRQRVDPPTQPTFAVPAQLDRADFPSPSMPWLVAVFSSATCRTCESTVRAAQALASSQVAVTEVEYAAARAVHEKYAIDAVPLVAIADADGVVRASFVGPVAATDLWAAVARVREEA